MRFGIVAILLMLPVTAIHADEVPAAAAPRPAEAVRKALGRLSHADPAARGAALHDLEQLLADHPALGPGCVPRLRNALRRLPAPARAQIVTLLGLIPGDAARALWIERLDPAGERDQRVLLAAVMAGRLRQADLAASRALARKVRSARMRPAHRALVYEALGWFGGPAPLLILARRRRGAEGGDEPWIEAAGRALGLGHRTDDASLPPLIFLLGHKSVAVRLAAWEGLVQRTKQGLPPERAVWLAWFKRYQNAPPAAAPAGPPPKGASRYAPAKHIHIPTYYGVPIPRPGSVVVFCLDASQSMYGDGITAARRHLRTTLLNLPMGHAFEIVAFNEHVMPFASRIVRAHPLAKWRALRWLEALEPTSYTNLYDAVETAFQYMGRGRRPATEPVPLDMVFLLSDGHPNRGRYRAGARVVKYIGRLSRREVPVHTVAVGDRVMGLLKEIASVTGGVFRDAFE